jgi:hypothetical protein
VTDDLEPEPEQRASINSALRRRASGRDSIDSMDLYVSAHERSGSIYRRQSLEGVLVAIVLVMLLVGALIIGVAAARHSQGGAAASKPARPVITRPTTVTTGPPTLGDTVKGCADKHIFSGATVSELAGRFGSTAICDRIGDTLVEILVSRDKVTTVLTLRCQPTDSACLDLNLPHDLAQFEVATVAAVPFDSWQHWNYYQQELPLGHDRARIYWFQSHGSTPRPLPWIVVRQTSSGTGVTVYSGAGCSQSLSAAPKSDAMPRALPLLAAQKALDQEPPAEAPPFTEPANC